MNITLLSPSTSGASPWKPLHKSSWPTSLPTQQAFSATGHVWKWTWKNFLDSPFSVRDFRFLSSSVYGDQCRFTVTCKKQDCPVHFVLFSMAAFYKIVVWYYKLDLTAWILTLIQIISLSYCYCVCVCLWVCECMYVYVSVYECIFECA